ncbi:DDE-type integrase/transposase/recombinase [Streptomyces sp. NPDC006510]|uniref:DDE-type integrase/transposase/recombinase n=1 Tax=Streptomyces sp. NPDC006510 TaxID=3155600 RepID=UPI0033B7B231
MGSKYAKRCTAEFKRDAGRLHLACWLDLATREVVGYSMADHHRADLVVDALKMAAGRGRLRPGCIAHSDRGSE